MDRFERENVFHHILGEIEKTDRFYNSFNNELAASLMPFLVSFFPMAVKHNLIGDALKTYSVAILNSTESVIDKDRNYPLYRLNDELETMSNVVVKLSFNAESLSFIEVVASTVKGLLVKYFNDIYQLSGQGFRLLELNVKLYNWVFHENLKQLLPVDNPNGTSSSYL